MYILFMGLSQDGYSHLIFSINDNLFFLPVQPWLEGVGGSEPGLGRAERLAARRAALRRRATQLCHYTSSMQDSNAYSLHQNVKVTFIRSVRSYEVSGHMKSQGYYEVSGHKCTRRLINKCHFHDMRAYQKEIKNRVEMEPFVGVTLWGLLLQTGGM